MERTRWIREKRRLAIKRYNQIFARDYDLKWGKIDKTHEHFLHKFLDYCPEKGRILDAACGTGKYFDILLNRGFNVTGIDQSEKMLSKAREKFPGVKVLNLGLQELDFKGYFDGVICIDAMENIFPEHWSLVLGNFFNALKSRGYLYFTVEILEEEEIRRAFEAGRDMGLPVVMGEVAHKGGYHYYPKIKDVREWVKAEGFQLVEETRGDGYHHFIVNKDICFYCY